MKNKSNIYYLAESDIKNRRKKAFKYNAMKILAINLLILLIALLITFALTLSQSTANAKNINTNNTASTTYINQENGNINFVIKEYEGYVAVYSSISDEPIEKYNTPVSSLPKKDQELLSKGIKVTNTKDLEKLIEDLTS